MIDPVNYIGEAPTFSTREIMIALLILLTILTAFIALVVVGIKGFLRIGRGRRDSLPARLAPLVAAIDVVFVVVFLEFPILAFAPATVHALAFGWGVNSRAATGPDRPDLDAED